jgi:hypothetical protein
MSGKAYHIETDPILSRLNVLPSRLRIAHLAALLRHERQTTARARSCPSPREAAGRVDANEMSGGVVGGRKGSLTLASASLRPSLPTAARREGSNIEPTIPIESPNDRIMSNGPLRGGRAE